MIDELTINQHYDACIQMWNEIAENGYSEKWETICESMYSPIHECFACELYKTDLETFASGCCVGCPFTKNKLYRHRIGICSCEDIGPYSQWFWGNKKTQKRNAIRISQLFIDNYPENEEG